MAKIPVGNFGQALPQAQQTQLPQDRSGQIIAGTLQGASQLITDTVEKIEAPKREAELLNKRLEVFNNELDKKEGLLKLDEVLTTEFSDKTTELRHQVGTGTLTAVAANEQLRAWSDERFTQLRTELPQHAMPDYENYWNAQVNKQSGHFLPLQLKATEQRDRVLNDRAFDIASRLGREEGRKYLQENLETSSESSARIQQRMFDFEQGQDRKELDSGIEVAVASGDIAALKQVRETIKDKQFLDSRAAHSYSMQISREVLRLEHNAQIEEDARVKRAGQALNAFKQQMFTGAPLGNELIENTGIAVKGTLHEAEYNFYVEKSDKLQNFAKLGTPEQRKEIDKIKAYQKNNKSNDPKSDNQLISTYEKIYAEKLKTTKENPTQALREAGINVPNLNPTLFAVDPAQAAKSIAEIGVYQLAQRDKDANSAISPISPDVLPDAQAAFNQLSVEGKLTLIGHLVAATQNIQGGNEVWQSTLQQLGDGDRTYYLAGIARAKNKKIEGEDLATTLMNGNYLIKNGKYALPNELEVLFREKYGNLIDYGSFEDDFNSFKQAYAVMANRIGEVPTDSKDLAKGSVVERAFDLVTGGVYQQPYGSWFGSFKTTEGGKFKAWKVPKPYAMTDDRFDANLEAGYASIAKVYGYDINSLKDFRLRPRIDKNNPFIMYSLLNENSEPLINPKTGNEIFIEFKGVTR